MATIEIDLDTFGGEWHVRIALDRDTATWARVTRPGAGGRFPVKGTYMENVVDGKALILHGVMPGGTYDGIPCCILGHFFMPTANKSGLGQAGHKGMELPAVRLNWKIVKFEAGDAAVAALDFDRKCVLAMELVRAKWPDKLPEHFWKLVTNPLLWGMVALHLIKSPKLWFKILKKYAGKMLMVWIIVSYPYRIIRILQQIDAAQTKKQLEDAGVALCDWFLDLGMDIAIAVVGEILAMRGAKIEGEGQGKGGSHPPEEAPKVSGPHPKEPASWRDAHEFLREQAEWFARDAQSGKLPPDQAAAALARAVSLRMQANLLKKFIIETVHHIEWVKKMAGHVNAYVKELEAMCPSGKLTEAAANKLKADFAKSGVDPAGTVDYHKFGQQLLDIGSNQNWKLHDIETAITSKLNAAISYGMKYPLNIRELKLPFEEMEAMALGKGMTPEMEAKIMDRFQQAAPEMLKVYKKVEDLAKAAFDARGSIADHAESPNVKHHTGTDPASLCEGGVDTAHALLQWRHYRAKAFSLLKCVTETGFMNKDKQPWVRLGLMLFSRVGGKAHCDPRTVSVKELMMYEVDDLASMARNLKVPTETE